MQAGQCKILLVLHALRRGSMLCLCQQEFAQVSAPLAALIYTAEPLWGALFAWVLLGERWGSTGWVGAFLIVSSSLAAQLSGQNSKSPGQLRNE